MEPNTFTQPVPAELARALAQAVAGYFGTVPYYFTASFEQLPNTTNPYDLSAPIFSVPTSLPTGYGVFGPFVNVMAGLQPALSTQATVAQVQVITSASPPDEFDFPQEGSAMPDAMFFTAEAVAKFVVPYYSSVFTATWAQTLLDSFQESTLALMVHLPWSESEDLSASGQPEAFIVGPAGSTLPLASPPS